MSVARHEVLAQEVRGVASRLLLGGEVVGVVGLRSDHGRVGPHLFTAADDLAALVLEPRHLLAPLCRTILSGFPEGRLGVVARGCDERALIEMAKLEQVNMERLVLIGLACSEDQARRCVCARPHPGQVDVGDEVRGVTPGEDERVRKLLAQDVEERRVFWQQEFARCIKCYGCRNACPVCICDECVLEPSLPSPPLGGKGGNWVARGQVPPELPFHLIRAYHVADKCIGCGACEAACPMHIPMTVLYVLLREGLREMFNYEAGMDVTQRSPLTTTLEEMPFVGGRMSVDSRQ